MASPIFFLLVSLLFFEINFGLLKHPSEYETSCIIKGSRIDCMFFVSTNWSFLEFRSWLDEIEGNVTEVNLKIKCLNGGSLFLPHPFRARKLRLIYVKDCLIDGFMSESQTNPNVTSIYPDTITAKALINVIFRENWKTMFELFKTPLTRSSVCGQESVVKSIKRNISYEYEMHKDISIEEIFLFGERFQEYRKSNFTCMYKNMVFLEDSRSIILSRSFFEVIADDHAYPSLVRLNFNSIGLHDLPQQLKRWFHHFPSLRRLDLSSNALSSFSFEHPDTSQPYLVIDLSKNNIVSVPDDLPNYLNGTTPVFIRLYDNPIHCDCNIKPLSAYLNIIREKQKHARMFSQNVLKVKCHSPKEKKGRHVLNLDLNNC